MDSYEKENIMDENIMDEDIMDEEEEEEEEYQDSDYIPIDINDPFGLSSNSNSTNTNNNINNNNKTTTTTTTTTTTATNTISNSSRYNNQEEDLKAYIIPSTANLGKTISQLERDFVFLEQMHKKFSDQLYRLKLEETVLEEQKQRK